MRRGGNPLKGDEVPLCPERRSVGTDGDHPRAEHGFIDETALPVALPAIQSTLGATAVDAQWVVAAYTLTGWR
ncbi:MAG TPA: hypothetical protein VHF46_04075 [Rubrobacteraceae bacterium]|nr:hypothetical protein [Rubrobacteraceae bacterium]